jgi:hypothetical protein
MRCFFLVYPRSEISQTLSGKSGEGQLEARQFYEADALRGVKPTRLGFAAAADVVQLKQARCR